MAQTRDAKTSRPRPVVLCVLDGWGHADVPAHNAIHDARTPNWDRLMATCPHAVLDASEEHVGLPAGQMGNSEVGHMNLGAGRIVMQDLPRVDRAVRDGSLARHPVLTGLVDTLKRSGGVCHLMGLLSPGGVHSHQDHIAALARILADAGARVAVHAFLDGRDTPPRSARDYLARFIADVGARPNVKIVTVSGRYYAMDRDKRWDRVAKAYACLVDGEGEQARTPDEAVARSYERGTDDEFVLPTAIAEYPGMASGDAILMANFRADRVREILGALLMPDFDGFARGRTVRFAAAVGMTEYSAALAKVVTALFPPMPLTRIFGEIVAQAGLAQLRIAETEKYAHVTFFFNGGEEKPFPGEDRILVPSPKVATYDLKPEMSAFEVTDKVVEAIGSGRYDAIVLNYANADMVGHTGDHAAAVKAIEALDTCLGRLAAAVEKAGGALLITADHGNAEQMYDGATGQAHTAHTSNKVPVVLLGGGAAALSDGCLADVAPTLLQIMGLPQPAEMTGRSLIARRADSARRATA